MKQVWLDHKQHIYLKENLPGTIAGHVRAALRIYITIVRRWGYSENLERDILAALDADNEGEQ